MYSHQIEQLAEQRQSELQARCQRGSHTGPARQDARAARPRQHRHPIRRRTGYALITIGLRLAYLAGED
jgi:hypothetical protein